MKINSGKYSKTSSKSGDNAAGVPMVRKLLRWYDKAGRSLPWRSETINPYHIWLSEIIMQQTRIRQGVPYFAKLVQAFPTVRDLAEAEEGKVLRLWQGLGYYSRARNMLKCAKIIVNDFEGKFPDSYEKLIRLPGIGAYTAAAVASISFNECRAVVDGNVYRVLSRIFGIRNDRFSGTGLKKFRQLAHELIPCSRPGDYNQSMMELGALICTPRNPRCPDCPVRDYCYAWRNDCQEHFPLKAKKSIVRERFFIYYVIHYKDSILMKRRTDNDIWKGLYDFFLIERNDLRDNKRTFLRRLGVSDNDGVYGIKSGVFRSNLSHQRILTRFIHYRAKKIHLPGEKLSQLGYAFYTRKEIEALPKPVLINNYLKDHIF
ncbi:MAG TPA: A/G-specific adenine glycosylase [Cyclobacteriaceae bacterium]|nr:A/G-specific adenine glycosylase [Cyclobacteriaceae bacterium]